MRIATLCVHAGMTPDPATGAVVPPVYLTSTYHQPKVGGHKGFEYSRTQNPTRQHLEEAIAALEGARHGICFASGMAAVDAAVRLLKPGDTVLSLYDVYGGTYRLLSRLAGPMGLKETYLTVDKLNAMEPASFPDVQMIWVESPTNPLLRIVDIRRLALCAAAKGALLVVDNTFATPILQRPLALGAAVVVHSGTKYLAGHSDVIIGALATNDDELAARLRFVQNAAGAVPGPMDCFLTHRGIKTLKHRMTAHCEGALAVARALSQVRGVSRVCYPGLCDDTAAAIARSQMEGMGGIVTIEIRGGRDAAMKFLESLKVFTLAESLGGVESLACHPATMTHASIPADVRQAIGITDGLVRLSAGIEDPQDLVEDAVQAARRAVPDHAIAVPVSLSDVYRLRNETASPWLAFEPRRRRSGGFRHETGEMRVLRLVEQEVFDELRRFIKDGNPRPPEGLIASDLFEHYNIDDVRQVYSAFARSSILKSGYDTTVAGILEYLDENGTGETSVIEAGVGEGFMWGSPPAGAKALRRRGNLVIHGIDFSLRALKHAAALSVTSWGDVQTKFIPHYASLEKVRWETLSPPPSWLVASLALHHLVEVEKLEFLSKARAAGVVRVSLIEVDASLDDPLKGGIERKLDAIDLYEDVFASVRREIKSQAAESVVGYFFKPELFNILVSPSFSLQERFMSSEQWARLVRLAGFENVEVSCAYRGPLGKYRLFHLSARS